MKKIETRRHIWFAGALLALSANAALANSQDVNTDEALEPLPRHEDIGQTVTHFIQRSHYNHIAVDDDLSSRVLDRYVESLDGNRMYLLASDIEFFDQFRYDLDDFVMVVTKQSTSATPNCLRNDQCA